MSGALVGPAAAAWSTCWPEVGSEEWLAARALLELSPALVGEAASWVAQGGGRPGALLDWVADVDREGRGWSSTERRLFAVAAALIDPVDDDGEPRTVPLVGLLDLMGSWEGDVWRILTDWGTGGNNAGRPGRWAVVRSLG